MRIDGLFNGQPLNQANVLDILGRLNIGDVIKAKVLEITSGELMLKLFDGTVFKAAAASDIDARPGELLELAVSGKSDGNITLETVKKNIKSESIQNEIKKLLISMNIAPKPENMELAGEFKAAGVNISPEIFKKAAEFIKKFSELTPDKAVFLASKDITPENGRIGALVTLLEGRLKLGKQLDNLQKSITALIDGAMESIPAPKPSGVTAQNTEAAAGRNPETAELPKEPSKAMPGRLLPETPPNNQDTEAIKIKLPSATLQDKETTTAAQPGQVRNTDTPPSAEAGRATTARIAGAVEQFLEKPAAAAGFEEVIDIIKPGTEKKTMEAGVKILENEAGELEKLKNSFKSMFIRTDSEELKSELDVKKLYRDLSEKLDTVKNTIAYAGLPGTEDITARVNNLNDGLRLLNQINYSTTYCQIPLNLSGFNTTGELYVMKRGHSRKRIDPGDATMFISLDTRNIGRIESIIAIKGKNVSMNLRACEQQVIDFIKENSRYLYNGLVEKGYRLVDVKYRLIVDEINPVNVERVMKKELEGGRNAVDMRI